MSECGKEGEEAADIQQHFAVQVRRCRENDQGGDQRKRRLEDTEGVGRLLRRDEIAFLCRELLRPNGERTRGRIGNAQFSDAGDQLQHKAADLALLGEVLVLVIEP